MKKVIAIFSVILFVAIYYCSNNVKIIESYTDYREKKAFIGSDKTGLGGLYGMSYLPEFRIPFYYNIYPAKKTAKKNIDLYIFCDSYLFFPSKQIHFFGLDTLIKIKWWEISTYKQIYSLDSCKHNVLVIEMTERYVRDICTEYYGIINLLKIDTTYCNKTLTEVINKPFTISDFLERHFFNPNINSNLELNLFDYLIFRPIKELKAEFNFKIFNRVNNDVFVDTAKNFLYYMPTVKGEQKMNSFFPLDSSELSKICSNLNNIYDYYKQKGFEDVYLAIIPNPVTMVNPHIGLYNDLIPKLYSVDSLRMKIFDIYSVFARCPQKFYSRNDTHWNSEGLQTWLNEFNKILEITSEKPINSMYSK